MRGLAASKFQEKHTLKNNQSFL